MQKGAPAAGSSRREQKRDQASQPPQPKVSEKSKDDRVYALPIAPPSPCVNANDHTVLGLAKRVASAVRPQLFITDPKPSALTQ
jgi:hypothetical protein